MAVGEWHGCGNVEARLSGCDRFLVTPDLRTHGFLPNFSENGAMYPFVLGNVLHSRDMHWPTASVSRAMCDDIERS